MKIDEIFMKIEMKWIFKNIKIKLIKIIKTKEKEKKREEKYCHAESPILD